MSKTDGYPNGIEDTTLSLWKRLDPPQVSEIRWINVTVTRNKIPWWKFWKQQTKHYLDGEPVPWWIKGWWAKGFVFRMWLKGHYKRIDKYQAGRDK